MADTALSKFASMIDIAKEHRTRTFPKIYNILAPDTWILMPLGILLLYYTPSSFPNFSPDVCESVIMLKFNIHNNLFDSKQSEKETKQFQKGKKSWLCLFY